MNNTDVAGILTTYAERARKARNKEKLKDIIRELKKELDLRRIESVVTGEVGKRHDH